MPNPLIRNRQLASDVARPNLLQNGGFEQWHYGVGPFTAAAGGQVGYQVADGWTAGASGGGSTNTVSRDSANADPGSGSTYCAALVTSIAGGGGYVNITQVPPAAPYRGKTLSFSVRVRCAQAFVTAYIWYDGTGSAQVNSAVHPGDGSWRTLTVTATVPANATVLNAGVYCAGSAAGTVYVDNASLVIGPQYQDYVPQTALPDAVPNQRLAADVARANQLVNGGFEVWQRGTGPFTAYGPDRWQAGVNGTDVLTVSRATGITNTNFGYSGSNYSAQCVYTKGSGNSSALLQYLKQSDGYQVANRTITVSMRVMTTTPGMCRVGLDCDAATNLSTASPRSAYHNGDGTWQTLTVTVITGNCSYVAVSAYFDTNSGTAYVDDAMCVVGSVACDYVGLPPADDLARCMRYYEQFGYQYDIYLGGYSGGAGQAWYLGISWKVWKVVTPTVTKVGTWTSTNAANTGTVDVQTPHGCRMATSSSAAGAFGFNNSNAGGYLTAEANP